MDAKLSRYIQHRLLAAAPRSWLIVLVASLVPAACLAQAESQQMPAAADYTYPDIVAVRQLKSGSIYVNRQDLTLYAMDARTAASRAGQPFRFCVGPCTQIWAPLAADPNAKPVGKWTVVTGAQGPQWAYKRNPVFTFLADKAPGAVAGDGYDEMWSVIAYVPPPPPIVVPPNVAPLYTKHGYILADGGGHALFVLDRGACDRACTGAAPFAAGMAASPVGDWSVLRDQDSPQWAYRNHPVFISQQDTQSAPQGAAILRP